MRSKEELYGHDPELRRALDDLTAGKESADPMYMAPPAIGQTEPEFDGNRFQAKTVPPGFLEFARTAVSPPLKLEEAPSKTAAAGQGVVAGLPVYAAPMVPPPANEPTVDRARVRLAEDVRVEPDPRRVDTLRTIPTRTPPTEETAGTAAAATAGKARGTGLTRKVLAGVLLFALGIFALTLVVTLSTFRQEQPATSQQDSTASAPALGSSPRPSTRPTVESALEPSAPMKPSLADSALEPSAPMKPSLADSALEPSAPMKPSLADSALEPSAPPKEPAAPVTSRAAARPMANPPSAEAGPATPAVAPARSERRPPVPRARPAPPSRVESIPLVPSEPAAIPAHDIPFFDRKPTPRTPNAAAPTPG